MEPLYVLSGLFNPTGLGPSLSSKNPNLGIIYCLHLPCRRSPHCRQVFIECTKPNLLRV